MTGSAKTGYNRTSLNLQYKVPFVVELVTFAVAFVSFATEFVALAIEFNSFAIESSAFAEAVKRNFEILQHF